MSRAGLVSRAASLCREPGWPGGKLTPAQLTGPAGSSNQALKSGADGEQIHACLRPRINRLKKHETVCL